MKIKDTKEPSLIAFWSVPLEQILKKDNLSINGLTSEQANAKRLETGPNTMKTTKSDSSFLLFLKQFKSPITLLLLFAAILSFFLNDHTDALIIISIVLFSTILGFWQEKTAGNAIAQLLAMVQIKTRVLRSQQETEIPVEEVVPGDIVLLSAGDVIPADCLLLEENELFVDEAAFTGETFPVEKREGVLPENTVLSKRINSLFMGSHVISGTAKALVINTGISTEFGHISQSLKSKIPETEFARGIRKFGYLLMQITLVMAILILGINILFHKPIWDSLLFTLAISVGLTPQLLPAIITVNLSQGAKRMAKEQVIIKRLSSIENFGNMDVLCSDKTGTLTEGKVKVHNGLDYKGNESQNVLALAKVNALLQQGFRNPIDDAIVATPTENTEKYNRMDEIPYDFIRKRISLLVSDSQKNRLISKGAVTQILEICTQVLDSNGQLIPITEFNSQIQKTYENLSSQGYRTLGIAYKELPGKTFISKTDEQEMIFAGFISLYDPLKEGIFGTINQLKNLGIQLKIITGDNALIAKSMSSQIGMDESHILTGSEMRNMSDDAFFHHVSKVQVFAEVEPNQKQRIIYALKKTGKVVGYMGDGINDASAIHAADVGLSVNTAVDVAKEAADIVLLNQDLDVLIKGVKEGRRTFANTQKYIFMATSANFGNMFSMAGASLFLPFLPLLPKQILLTNLLTDFPAMSISTDNVDDAWINKPRRWDINFIKRFMLFFGILSSVFDYITFGVLMFIFKASAAEFQTGWFLESVVSATLIVLVVRSQKSIHQSKPSKYLLIATLSVVLFVLLFPLLPISRPFGFISLPIPFYITMLGIVAMYIISAEVLKRIFYKKSN